MSPGVETPQHQPIRMPGQRRPVVEYDIGLGVEGEFPKPLGREAARAFTLSATRSASSGSAVSGRSPAKPRSTARSVAWPLPVKAREPRSSACSRASGPVPGFRPSGSRSTSRKRAAATIGPIVCDDDGPIPILKMSKTLRNMDLRHITGRPPRRQPLHQFPGRPCVGRKAKAPLLGLHRLAGLLAEDAVDAADVVAERDKPLLQAFISASPSAGDGLPAS